MPREFSRSDRVAQTLMRHLAMILNEEVSDPRVAGLTITEVEVTKDLRQAKVFVTKLSEEDANHEEILMALEKANGFIRRHVAQVIDMRHVPSLLFRYDNSISESAKMSALINKALYRD